jgi:hypothetical protein
MVTQDMTCQSGWHAASKTLRCDVIGVTHEDRSGRIGWSVRGVRIPVLET